MTTVTTNPDIDPTTRRVPRLGGFNMTLLGIELKRVLRNRRTLIFALVLPAALFFVFGSGDQGAERVGDGNVSAYVMVSMALYGGALIAASTGSGVALERALGWSRQLRLTPLHPAGGQVAIGGGAHRRTPSVVRVAVVPVAVVAVVAVVPVASSGERASRPVRLRNASSRPRATISRSRAEVSVSR